MVEVSKSSSSLPKLILCTFLVVAGLYFLGLLEKVAVYVRAYTELRTNSDLIWYEKKKNELLCNKGVLDWQKSKLDIIEKSTTEMIKEKKDLEKKVEDLKKDPVLQSLQGYVDIIEKGKNESFLRVLRLRERVKEFWDLIEEWHGQHGFESRFESLKWADEVLMKEENPLSYPEERLKSDLEEFQKGECLFYSSELKAKPLTFYFDSFKGKDIQQLTVEDFNKAKEELNVLKQSNINDYNEDKEFKREFDELSCRLEKFKKDFENFKKAKEKLNEIRVLKKICCKEIFGDDVELRIKEIVEAVEKIDAENHCTVPLEFDIVKFKFGLENGKEFYRYVFTRKDFKKIEDFISEVCHKMGIANKEQRIEELERKLESENSYGEELKKSILNMEESIKKINKELESKKDAKERIEYLDKKQKDVTENLVKPTFPGKYTFFY